MNNDKDTKNRRLFDISIPIAIAELKQEFKDFKTEVSGKLDNGISGSLQKINDKVMSLPCDVHVEKMLSLQIQVKHIDRKTNGLYWAFVIVIICGIVLSLWVNRIKAIQQKVSLAEGREGYRVSQMIYRDLYTPKKEKL